MRCDLMVSDSTEALDQGVVDAADATEGEMMLEGITDDTLSSVSIGLQFRTALAHASELCDLSRGDADGGAAMDDKLAER